MVHGPHGSACWHMWHFTLTPAIYVYLSPHWLSSVFPSCRSLFVFSLITQENPWKVTAERSWTMWHDMTWLYRYRQPLPGWWLCRALWHWSAPNHLCQRPCLSNICTMTSLKLATLAAFWHVCHSKQRSSLSSPLYAKLQEDLDVQQRVQGLSHLRWSKPDHQPV